MFKALKQHPYKKLAINIHRETFTVLLRTTKFSPVNLSPFMVYLTLHIFNALDKTIMYCCVITVPGMLEAQSSSATSNAAGATRQSQAQGGGKRQVIITDDSLSQPPSGGSGGGCCG